jgi:hypothetical protein
MVPASQLSAIASSRVTYLSTLLINQAPVDQAMPAKKKATKIEVKHWILQFEQIMTHSPGKQRQTSTCLGFR